MAPHLWSGQPRHGSNSPLISLFKKKLHVLGCEFANRSRRAQGYQDLTSISFIAREKQKKLNSGFVGGLTF
jgi:hypothetical protein